jgi:acylphosphatase
MTSRRVIITGRVQGVGFRWTTKDLARGFDVCGSVRNLPDGSVEILIMGERGEVDAFLKELSEESALAHHVKTLHSQDIPPLEGVRGFSIAR